MPAAGASCPCGRRDARGRTLAFAQCCGSCLESAGAAPDALTLMRSRYTAYVLGDEAYLLSSWHPRTRPAAAKAQPGVKWLGLEVRSHRETDPTHADVEFVARYRVQGRAVRLHERSRFLLEDGRWYYVDGEML